MDDLTFSDLERIQMAGSAHALGWLKILMPALDDFQARSQPKPDPEQDRKHWRRVFAANAMLGEIQHQGLEGRDAAHIAGMAYEMADAMLRHEGKEQEVPRG